MKKSVLAIILIVVLAIIGFYCFRSPTDLPIPLQIDTTDQPTLGKENASVQIVAFEDLKCSNCMRFSTILLPKIKKQFIDTGIAKFTLINVAFIPGSLPAANAARCLYVQNKNLFFPFVEAIYQKQPPETQDWATTPYLLDTASKISGVDKDKLGECIVANPYSGVINDNFKQAMKLMDGRVATPAVYVNGMLVKPLTLDRMKILIKAAQK